MENKKRQREDQDIASGSSALSTTEGPVPTGAILYCCSIYNALSRNRCNQEFDDVKAFKRHLKIQHMRLPKDYEKYCSVTPRIKH